MSFKNYREKVGLTQQEVAAILNISNTTVCMWETGKSHLSAEMLPRIAALYGCTISELFEAENAA